MLKNPRVGREGFCGNNLLAKKYLITTYTTGEVAIEATEKSKQARVSTVLTLARSSIGRLKGACIRAFLYLINNMNETNAYRYSLMMNRT